MLRLAFDFIITWRETRTRPNAYDKNSPHWAGYTERPYLKKHSFRIKVRTRLFFIGCEL